MRMDSAEANSEITSPVRTVRHPNVPCPIARAVTTKSGKSDHTSPTKTKKLNLARHGLGTAGVLSRLSGSSGTSLGRGAGTGAGTGVGTAAGTGGAKRGTTAAVPHVGHATRVPRLSTPAVIGMPHAGQVNSKVSIGRLCFGPGTPFN